MVEPNPFMEIREEVVRRTARRRSDTFAFRRKGMSFAQSKSLAKILSHRLADHVLPYEEDPKQETLVGCSDREQPQLLHEKRNRPECDCAC